MLSPNSNSGNNTYNEGHIERCKRDYPKEHLLDGLNIMNHGI